MNYYIIEYFDEYDDFKIKRIKSHNAIEALSELYSYLYSINDIGTKCISKADDIEEAIKIFERVDDLYHIRIANIYTMGNWVYCTIEQAREIAEKLHNDPVECKWFDDSYKTMSDEDLINIYFFDSMIQTADGFFDNNLEEFEETYVTPGGETVIAFGVYGYDG